jgi:hypothetical protein
MSGVPIIPISFTAKVTQLTPTTVTLEPNDASKLEYFVEGAFYDIHASPAAEGHIPGEHGHSGDGEGSQP